jgi:hypothetical protein
LWIDRWARPVPARAPVHPSWLLREDQIFASPGPTEILCTGDVLVVIGTEDGIAGVKRIVDEG